MKKMFSQLLRMCMGRRFYLLLLIMLCSVTSYAFQSEDFYACCNVKVASGSGTVYVGTKETNTPSYASRGNAIGKSTSYEVVGQDFGLDPTKFYLYAMADDDFYFDGWTQTEGGISGMDDSQNQPFEVSILPTSTNYDSPAPVQTYYAVFKHYVYGYANGRDAIVNEGDMYGEISLDGLNWSKSVSEKVSGEPVAKKHKGDALAEGEGEDYITLTYHARFKTGYDENTCYFIGWHHAD